MGRVAGEEQPAVPHWLHHHAAHRGHPLVEHLASLQSRLAEPCPQLLPDPVLGPGGRVLVSGHLQVEAADLGRPHALQREAALVVGVDQLL